MFSGGCSLQSEVGLGGHGALLIDSLTGSYDMRGPGIESPTYIDVVRVDELPEGRSATTLLVRLNAAMEKLGTELDLESSVLVSFHSLQSGVVISDIQPKAGDDIGLHQFGHIRFSEGRNIDLSMLSEQWMRERASRIDGLEVGDDSVLRGDRGSLITLLDDVEDGVEALDPDQQLEFIRVEQEPINLRLMLKGIDDSLDRQKPDPPERPNDDALERLRAAQHVDAEEIIRSLKSVPLIISGIDIANLNEKVKPNQIYAYLENDLRDRGIRVVNPRDKEADPYRILAMVREDGSRFTNGQSSTRIALDLVLVPENQVRLIREHGLETQHAALSVASGLIMVQGEVTERDVRTTVRNTLDSLFDPERLKGLHGKPSAAEWNSLVDKLAEKPLISSGTTDL